MHKQAFFTEEQILKNKINSEKSSGVYFLIKDNLIVYVGQSTNCINRIGDHKRTKLFDSYSIIECDNEWLNALESFYIHKFKPELNARYRDNTICAPIKEGVIKEYFKFKRYCLYCNDSFYQDENNEYEFCSDQHENDYQDKNSPERPRLEINKMIVIEESEYKKEIYIEEQPVNLKEIKSINENLKIKRRSFKEDFYYFIFLICVAIFICPIIYKISVNKITHLINHNLSNLEILSMIYIFLYLVRYAYYLIYFKCCYAIDFLLNPLKNYLERLGYLF